MYATTSRGRHPFGRVVRWTAAWMAATFAASALAQADSEQQVVKILTRSTERLEMTVNSSQILTLGSRIPRLKVNNPELVTATPLSENQVQLAARKPGVTQVNLWDENGRIYTVDLLIFGDVRELEMALKQMFPGSSLKVVRLTNSLVLEGQVDRPEIVSTIRSLAEDYAPKVVNNITVGGVQQVLLKVKVMEVSRTKLRRMGADFGVFGQNGFGVSSVSGIINSFDANAQTAAAGTSTVSFGVIDNGTSFLGFLNLLQQKQVAKILADPMLVTVSGRPASFNVGGELPILVPSSLGQVSIEYKKFGTQVDFVPIVLGDGNIRLEVRPRLSEIDDTRSVTVNSFVVPALKVREVDTGVEMKAGQTLALAGLIQERIETSHRGMPFVSDLPVVGAAFRKVEENRNEIENLILVTPEFVDAMDPHEVPQCGPGMETMPPTNVDFYWKGIIETPACGPCGASDPCSCNAPGLRCDMGTSAQLPNGAAMATDYSGYPPNSAYPAAGYPATRGVPVEPLVPTPSGSMQGVPAPADAAPLTIPDPSAHDGRTPWQGPVPPQTARRPVAGSIVPGRMTSTPGLIGPVGYDVQK